MSPLIVAVILSVVSFAVGGALAWRLLDRGQRGNCRTLAQELTEKVHDHVAAYQQLEERINLILSDFDQQQGEMGAEQPGRIPIPIDPQRAVETAEGQVATVMESDELAWMDACSEPQAALPDAAFQAPPEGRPVVVEESVQETENVVDRFAARLQIMQREKTAELENQRRAIEGLDRRVQGLESSIDALWKKGVEIESGHSAAHRATEQRVEADLVALSDRIARSEQEIAAWHRGYEKLARERMAHTEHARELAARMDVGLQRSQKAQAAVSGVNARLEQLARALAELQTNLPARDLRSPTREPRVAPSQRAPARDPRSPLPAPVPEAHPSVAAAVAEPSPSEHARPQAIPDGTLSQLGKLMKSLENAKGEVESYRSRLEEQNSQFTAAYAMLERMRPLVQALENEFATHTRGIERRRA